MRRLNPIVQREAHCASTPTHAQRRLGWACGTLHVAVQLVVRRRKQATPRGGRHVHAEAQRCKQKARVLVTERRCRAGAEYAPCHAQLLAERNAACSDDALAVIHVPARKTAR
jgi:hypothetical protein